MKENFYVWKNEYVYELIDNYRQYLLDIANTNQREYDIREVECFDEWVIEEFRNCSQEE